jgi:hypothetical protein
MRRLLTIAMTGTLALALAACGGLNDDDGSTGTAGGGGGREHRGVRRARPCRPVVLRWEYRDGFVLRVPPEARAELDAFGADASSSRA